jgi:hypothetical protein
MSRMESVEIQAFIEGWAESRKIVLIKHTAQDWVSYQLEDRVPYAIFVRGEGQRTTLSPTISKADWERLDMRSESPPEKGVWWIRPFIAVPDGAKGLLEDLVRLAVHAQSFDNDKE